MSDSRDEEVVRLGHGGGGLLMRDLLRQVFVPAFYGGASEAPPLEDAAVLAVPETDRFAFTTDGFVVDPPFFPGGDIGDLAVNGTVNDLAMMGAVPRHLAVAMIVEEGTLMSDLRAIVTSMARAARAVPVDVVAGDTKVVPKGKGDGVYVTTSGVGEVRAGVTLSAASLEPGDRIVVSGPIGDHGVAVMSRRAGLSFEADVQSDTAPLSGLVQAMLAADRRIHALRDPTRGGLAAALVELAEDSAVAIDVDEEAIPVRPAVGSACDVLGLDPMHVPCEGRLVAAVPEVCLDAVLDAMRSHPHGEGATVVGQVKDRSSSRVILRTRVGGARLVDLPAGELLPRIC